MKPALAIALTLWLGGASCLLGCLAAPAADDHCGARRIDDPASPLFALPTEYGQTCDLCQPNGRSETRREEESERKAQMSCCPSAGQPGVLAKRVTAKELDWQPGFDPQPLAAAVHAALQRLEQALPDGRDLHLRDRVLLI